MADERDPGFGSRNILTAALVLILCIFGPLDHSWPAWLAIRIGYLIAIPTVTRLLLNWIWKRCSPTEKTEDRFERALYAVMAGILATWAIQSIETPIKFPDPQWGGVALILFFAGAAFYRSVLGGERLLPRWWE